MSMYALCSLRLSLKPNNKVGKKIRTDQEAIKSQVGVNEYADKLRRTWTNMILLYKPARLIVRFLLIQYLSNKTKFSTNTETAMLSRFFLQKNAEIIADG